jgi:hypothetical protein
MRAAAPDERGTFLQTCPESSDEGQSRGKIEEAIVMELAIIGSKGSGTQHGSNNMRRMALAPF